MRRSFTNIGKEEGLLQVIISEGVHEMNDISFTPFAASHMEKIETNLSKNLRELCLNLVLEFSYILPKHTC